MDTATFDEPEDFENLGRPWVARMGDWEEGFCIDERFLLGQKLGKAEATVWRGKDVSSGASVLIVEHSAIGVKSGSKIAFQGEQDARKREAAVASGMACEQHVPVLGIGDWDGRSYVVTEDVHGETVEHVARSFRNHVLDEETIVKVARDVLKGLAAAEAVGLVHGDVCGEPHNPHPGSLNPQPPTLKPKTTPPAINLTS